MTDARIELRKQVIELHEAGKSLAEISAITGLRGELLLDALPQVWRTANGA
jgi:hypothetical protein